MEGCGCPKMENECDGKFPPYPIFLAHDPFFFPPPLPAHTPPSLLPSPCAADGSQSGSMSYNQSFTANKGAFDIGGSISGSMGGSESYAMAHVRGWGGVCEGGWGVRGGGNLTKARAPMPIRSDVPPNITGIVSHIVHISPL